MTKEQFQELLKRYRAGNCSPEEINKVDEWFASISNEGLELHGTDKAQTHHRILSAIRQTLPAPGPKSIRSDRFLAMKIAAGVTIFIVAGYFLLSNRALPLSSSQGSSSDDMLKFSNATAGILTLTLPDASVIELRPKAEVSYAKSWNGDKREVHLSGEAFFEVVKDIKRPFYVYGGSVVTKVLGTSFTVHALPMAESVQVAVHTGKVSVYERTAGSTAIQRGLASSGVVLSPNEKVEYFVKGKHWVTGLVADP
ncbi:MAG TPA: FecR family protein, partial [Chryseosolibacter sp.]|nr:FecR family protein [Chryseosolibacter sp.]